jgi:hypothetical protein
LPGVHLPELQFVAWTLPSNAGINSQLLQTSVASVQDGGTVTHECQLDISVVRDISHKSETSFRKS